MLSNLIISIYNLIFGSSIEGDGYFLNPKNMALFPISKGGTHFETILTYPGEFNLNKNDVEELQNLPFIDAENLANKKIIEAGWIRLRWHIYGDKKELTIQNSSTLSSDQLNDLITNFPNIQKENVIVLDDIAFSVSEYMYADKNIDKIRKQREISEKMNRPTIKNIRSLPD